MGRMQVQEIRSDATDGCETLFHKKHPGVPWTAENSSPRAEMGWAMKNKWFLDFVNYLNYLQLDEITNVFCPKVSTGRRVKIAAWRTLS